MITRTQFKKMIAAIGFILNGWAAFMLYTHKALEAVFPKYSTSIEAIALLAGSLAMWWGQHPWASPSVVDATLDGTVHADISRVKAANP